MATAYDWIKLALDKWTVILPVCLFLASATGLTFSAIDNAEKDELTRAMKEQITILAKPKEVIVKSNCSPCGSYLNKHLKEYH